MDLPRKREGTSSVILTPLHGTLRNLFSRHGPSHRPRLAPFQRAPCISISFTSGCPVSRSPMSQPDTANAPAAIPCQIDRLNPCPMQRITPMGPTAEHAASSADRDRDSPMPRQEIWTCRRRMTTETKFWKGTRKHQAHAAASKLCDDAAVTTAADTGHIMSPRTSKSRRAPTAISMGGTNSLEKAASHAKAITCTSERR